MSIYETLGVRTIINAKGTATRLSGGIMAPEVAQAMMAASQACVDMADLQAAASREIAAITGAEAGYVASGAAACLMLSAAAAIAGLDPGKMARLPDTAGMANEIIMVRSQRNGYDHAIRAAGTKIVEVGLPDRFSGAGVRDAETWEIEDAITENTVAIFYVAGALAQPSLPEVTAMARRRKIPVIVDAAAQLPPSANLQRFITDGADLVAFSGGKVLGGPQASGFVCGRRDLVMSIALQHLDLDVYADMWSPPPTLIDRTALKGIPQHGIGRTNKAGKEEIVGLLTALRLFAGESDAIRHRRWLGKLEAIAAGLSKQPTLDTAIENGEDTGSIPLLTLRGRFGPLDVTAIGNRLAAGTPSIAVDASRRTTNVLVVNPVCVADSDIDALIAGLRGALSA